MMAPSAEIVSGLMVKSLFPPNPFQSTSFGGG
jgi:hypothetical protein